MELRLYPGQDDRLIAWLQTLEGQPFGVKSQAIKAALLHGIDAGSKVASAPAVDWTTLLPEIRRVVEAAVANALSQQGWVVAKAADAPPTDAAEALLAALDHNLLLEEDSGI